MTSRLWIYLASLSLGSLLGCTPSRSLWPDTSAADREPAVAKAASFSSAGPMLPPGGQKATGPHVVLAEHREPTPQAAAPVEPPRPPDPRPLPILNDASANPPPAPDLAVVVALRQLLQNHPERAMEEIRGMDPANQELLIGLLPLVARISEGSLSSANPEVLANLLDQLASLESALSVRAPLTISRMCYCREAAKGFGRFEPLSPSQGFRAGSNGEPGETVHVYVEYRNLAWRQVGEFFETCQGYRLEIRDRSGAPVRHDKLPVLERRRSACKDMYQPVRLEVPAGMPPGDYMLVVQIEDALTSPPRLASHALEFHVTEHGATAPRRQ